jgi:hypothetical protein
VYEAFEYVYVVLPSFVRSNYSSGSILLLSLVCRLDLAGYLQKRLESNWCPSDQQLAIPRLKTGALFCGVYVPIILLLNSIAFALHCIQSLGQWLHSSVDDIYRTVDYEILIRLINMID